MMEQALVEYEAGNTNITGLARKHGIPVHTLTRRLKKEGLFKPSSLTFETAKEKLVNLTDRYVLLDYAKHSNDQSKFFDKVKNIEFEYRFRGLIDQLLIDPTFIPRPSKEEISAKISASLAKLDYNPNQTPEAIAKRKATCIERYGAESPFQSVKIQGKIKQSVFANYGVENPFQSEEIKEKIKQTNLERYGVEYAAQCSEIREKAKKTNLERYGVEHSLQYDKFKEKAKQTRITNGNSHLIEGKTLNEWAEETGRATSSLNQLYNQGIDITVLTKNETSIEQPLSVFLDSLNVNYIHNKQLLGTPYRPDFQLPDHKLIIECDGLYWHSDAKIKDKYYHQKKKEAYTKMGYRSLFFREDEIIQKLPIVQSIITNALQLNTNKIFARKCEIKPLDPSFFSQYHLMGKGAGRCYGLFYQDNPVLGIQVKWVNKKTKLLEVSRFCSAPNTSVTGGFSKLLKYIKKQETPNQLQTFIDRRYGAGSYLQTLGFKEQSTYLSFKWTNCKQIYNRMQFKGNTGYDYGLFKMWDCGQTKWYHAYEQEGIQQ